VATNRGDWICRTVVLAAGACNIATVPPLAAGVPSSVEWLTPQDYRNPGQLRPGRVLVVGASATGIQLADEIQRFGPPGDALSRRACQGAARLSQQGHPMVDGAAGVLDER
jgi:putative flavoprotein involved in K+ transport